MMYIDTNYAIKGMEEVMEGNHEEKRSKQHVSLCLGVGEFYKIYFLVFFYLLTMFYRFQN